VASSVRPVAGGGGGTGRRPHARAAHPLKGRVSAGRSPSLLISWRPIQQLQDSWTTGQVRATTMATEHPEALTGKRLVRCATSKVGPN
jgi:hypothetical protein